MKVKVRKFKRKNCFYLVALVFVIILFTIFYLHFNSYEYKLRKIGYNSAEIKLINNKQLDKETKELFLKNKYIKYITNIFSEQSFDETKIEYYINVYTDYDDKYDSNLIEIINDKYFKIKKTDEYIRYYKNNSTMSSREIVENVNCGLGYEYYTVDNKVDLTKGNLMLVNKYNRLSSDYIPKELVKIDKKYGYQRNVEKTVYEAFKKMYDDMGNEKLYIFITSPYRSYEYQEKLYNDYVAKNGQTKADTFSARPGYSEHQTGLAIDIAAKNSIYTKFASTKEYQWMLKNSHKYGFILRYPEGKEKQTGYMFESWHYRYVGIEVATYIYKNNITFDEYYEYFLNN